MSRAASSGPDGMAAIAAGFVDPAQDLEIKRGYLRWLAGARRVLDLGCGEGRLLEVLREAGITGLGVEASAAAVARCAERGLAVEQGELPGWLGADPRRFDAVALVHLIEHFAPPAAQALLEAAAAALEPGGTLLLVTPNHRNQIVVEETFWLDPTHVRPYPRALLERMCAAAGLSVAASYDDPRSGPRRRCLRQVLARARSWLSGVDRAGPMDAVVVALRS